MTQSVSDPDQMIYIFHASKDKKMVLDHLQMGNLLQEMCSVLLLIEEICTENLESTKCMIENKRLQIDIKANLFIFHSRF